MSDRVAAETFDAREYCRDELRSRDWAEYRLPAVVRWWLRNPSVGMSANVAVGLSEAFGTTPRLWLNLGKQE